MMNHLSIIIICSFSLLLYLVKGNDPVFLTTLSDYEAGSWVLTTTNPLSNNGFDSETTTVSYSNLYNSTPKIGLGLNLISSSYQSTTGFHSYIYDIVITSTSTSSAALQLNRTSNSINLIRLNYIVTTTFFDIRHTLIDLQSDIVYTSTSSL